MERITLVKCTRKYFDIEMNREVNKNETLEITKKRANVLIDNKVCELVSIKKHKEMIYERIYLFRKQKSRGSFDDFFDTTKYNTLQQAYDANDYVECDFVKDQSGTIYIEARNVKQPDIRKYHSLNHQRPVAGLDMSDDRSGCELAESLF